MCKYPTECCMAHTEHTESECHTPDMVEMSSSAVFSTALRDDYEKLKEAASCIRHWHDAANDGMVVSAEHVRKLWTVLEEIQ